MLVWALLGVFWWGGSASGAVAANAPTYVQTPSFVSADGWQLPPAMPYEAPLPELSRRAYTSPDDRRHVGLGGHTAGDATGLGGVAITLRLSINAGWWW